MTTPSGGGNNGISLATLWIPVVPETSQLGPKMREAGEIGRKSFEEGFTSGGSGSTVFDRMAQQLSTRFSDEISAGLQRGLSGMELPGGMSRVTESLMRGFEGVAQHTEKAEQATKEYERAHERLTQALEREAVAQARLDDLHAKGAQGGQLAAGLAAVEAAHRRVSQAADADTAAHEQLQKTLDSGSSKMLTFATSTGVVSGAISAGIMLAAEALTEGTEAAVEGFEKVIETGEEMAKELIEVGEDFESLHRAIELSTTASGEQLEELKSHADALAGSLDTSFDKVGTDMAVFSSRLNLEAGPALDSLTKHVEELRDRFGSLDASALAGAFQQFGVDGEHADAALASLVHTSREYGVSLNGLINDLTTAGPALQEFDLTIEQSGHLLGELEAQHINAAGAVNALARAEKGAAAQHVELKDFVQQELTVIRQYVEANNIQAAQQEAYLAFGTRGYKEAMAAAKSYLETVAAGKDAFKGSTAEEDHLIATTQNLENRWTALRNSMEVEFAPVAGIALEGINAAVSKLGEWIRGHSGEVLDWVKHVGEAFINAIPAVQEFAAKTIEAMEPWLKALQWMTSKATEALGGMLEVAANLSKIPIFKGLFGDWSKELNEAAVTVSKAGKEIGDFDLGGVLDKWHKGITDFRPDLQGWTSDLDKSTDALKRHLDELNSASSASSGVVAAPGDVGHIAPPPSAFGGTDDSGGGEPGGAEPPTAEQPGEGEEGGEGATPVHPRSWNIPAPDNNGVGGPHVVMANWHPRVEQVDQFTEKGGGAPHNPGERKVEGDHHGEHGGHQQHASGTTGRQDRSHQRRLEDLDDKIQDDSDSIKDLTQAQRDQSAKLKSDTALRDSYIPGTLAWINENKIVIQDNKELSHTTKELNRTLRDRTRSEEDISDENQNYADAKNKGKGKGGEGDSPAHDFGSQFLSGIMDDLGLGGLFGKSPLDWGITKTLKSFADWGVKALDGDGSGGDSGGGGFGGGGGAGAGGGGGGAGSLLERLLNPGAAGTPTAGASQFPQVSPFIFGDHGAVSGPEGKAPGPGQPVTGVPHLPGGAPAAPGPATQHPAPPPAGVPGDSITPGAPTPTPVPTPHMTPTPGLHPTGFDSGGGGATPGGLSMGGWHPPFSGAGGGVNLGGYGAAVAPRLAQLGAAHGLSVPLTVNPDGSVSSPNPAWQHLLTRESGGRNVPQGIKDANSGGNEAQGFFQITPQTWRAHGGTEFAPNPMAATADQQAAIAARILQANPGGGDWGAGGPGRENAADLLAGLSGDTAAGGAPYSPANFPPAAAGGGGDMAQRWQAAVARGAIGPNGELAPGTAAGSEQGLQQNTIRGRRLMSALFPELQNIGGVRQDSLKWHPQGLALDLMIPGQGGLNDPTTPQGLALGNQINDFIHSNMGALGSDYTMWQEANHYNHVHDNYMPSGYPSDPNQQYFVPQGLNLGPGVDDSVVGARSPQFRGAAAVTPGPTPPAMNVPNVNQVGPQHYTGPTLPGPAPSVSSGPHVQSNMSQSSVGGASAGSAMSGMWGLLGSLIGGPDFNPRTWEGILHQPDRGHAQHSGGASVQHITQNFDHSIDMSGSTVADPRALKQQMQEEMNARYYSVAGGLPTSGIGSP